MTSARARARSTASRPDGSFAAVLAGVTISNGLDWSDDGATAFYVDTTTGRIDTLAFDAATGG